MLFTIITYHVIEMRKRNPACYVVPDIIAEAIEGLPESTVREIAASGVPILSTFGGTGRAEGPCEGGCRRAS